MGNAGGVGDGGGLQTPDYTGLLDSQNKAMTASLNFQTASSNLNVGFDAVKTAWQTASELTKNIQDASHLMG